MRLFRSYARPAPGQGTRPDAGAELLGKTGELGRIAPGYLADIIAVDGMPDRDIETLRDVAFVMANGEVVEHD